MASFSSKLKFTHFVIILGLIDLVVGALVGGTLNPLKLMLIASGVCLVILGTWSLETKKASNEKIQKTGNINKTESYR